MRIRIHLARCVLQLLLCLIFFGETSADSGDIGVLSTGRTAISLVISARYDAFVLDGKLKEETNLALFRTRAVGRTILVEPL